MVFGTAVFIIKFLIKQFDFDLIYYCIKLNQKNAVFIICQPCRSISVSQP